MTHDELYRKIEGLWHDSYKAPGYMMLLNVIKLHKPTPEGRYPENLCQGCSMTEEVVYVYYPCRTIQAVEKELK